MMDISYPLVNSHNHGKVTTLIGQMNYKWVMFNSCVKIPEAIQSGAAVYNSSVGANKSKFALWSVILRDF